MIKRLFCATLYLSTAHAMVFDNRFLPLLLKPFTRRCDALSHVRVQPFFMHADQAFANGFEKSIPDICQNYDQRVLAQALVKKGLDEPLRSDFVLRTSIPWARIGRLDAQGLAFLYEHAFCEWFSVGINALFVHAAMRHEFFLRSPENNLPAGDKNYLLQAKEQMHDELGVGPAVFSRTGFGDIDLYLRFGGIWDYPWKCRRIDSSIKCGVYIPTATARDFENPASIPFGGSRHWGLYVGAEADVELKEDLSLGVMLRAIKRVEKTDCVRMPALSEPPEYGVIKAPFQIDPGWTFVFNPYATLSSMRQGFGVQVLYTLIAHLKDSFFDRRPAVARRALPAEIAVLKNCSSWGSEYVSVAAFYDFKQVYDCPPLYPKVSAYWDIPVDWLVSKNAAQTHCVSLMIECDF